MDSQLNENVKKYSRATLIATLTNVVVALAMLISGFLPFMIVDGEKYGMLDFIGIPGFFEEGGPIYFFLITMIGPSAIAIIWAAIPKMWAAVVGIIYALPLIFWAYVILISMQETIEAELEFLAGGFVFRKYFSILLLVLSIVKLIFTIRDKKRA